MGSLKNILIAGVVVAGLAVVPGSLPASSQTAAEPAGFVGVTPTRVLDTRSGVGVSTPAPLGAGATLDLPLTTAAPNRPGIPVPAGAIAVLLNVTVDADATAASYITVWPTGQDRPTTSVINPKPGTVTAGSILVPLGIGGDVSIFNYAGDVNIIVDLAGYTSAISGGAGTPGPPGPPGPSDAFTGNTFGFSIGLSTTPVAVKSLSVEPGAYVFMASVRLISQSAGTTNVDCYIQPSGLSNSNFANVDLTGTSNRKFVSLNYATTLADPVAVNLNCEITVGGAASADEIFFTAIKVGTVTEQ
jgi:hypothetical protein